MIAFQTGLSAVRRAAAPFTDHVRITTTGHAIIEDDAVLPYSHCSGGSALISGEREEGCMAALSRMVF